MQSSNQSTMESVKECHIQLHSSPNVLPYQVVDDGQGLKSPTTNLVDDLLPERKSVGDRRSQPCSPIGAAEEKFGLFTIALNCAPIREGPFHFIFTIDTTLSMTEKDSTGITKIEYMKGTLIKMLSYLEDLDPQIYVTIYTFNETSNLVVNNILLNKGSVQFLEEFIKEFKPENRTNIQIALETAKTVTEKIKNDFPDRQLAHIFMTDGEANVGITDPTVLANLINTSLPNVFIGFGKDHNSRTLSQFARCKNCEYYFVDNLENSVLVYAESIHNILCGVFYDVEFHISNGELYDYQKNEWTCVLYENVLSSESNKYYQLKTSHPEDVEVYVICGQGLKSPTTKSGGQRPEDFGQKSKALQQLTAEGVKRQALFGNAIIDIGEPLPDLYDTDGELLLTDLTKYAYRKKVQELLYLSSSDKYDDKPSEIEMRDVFSEIRKYMCDNKMMDDPLLKLLSEDLYVAIKTMDLGEEKSCMYAAARQTSQGRQRSYNVGSSIPETVNYDDIPRLVRGTNDPYDFQNFTLERSTTTCFASPTMISTFIELSQDITTPIDSQSPISQDFEC